MKKHSLQLTPCSRRTKPKINHLKPLFKMQLESCARAVIASENRSTYGNNINTEIDFIPTLYTLFLRLNTCSFSLFGKK